MKISKILSYAVLAVGAISIMMWVTMNNGVGRLMDENSVSEARELPMELAGPEISGLYGLTLFIMGLIFVVTVIAIISNLVKNPAVLKNTAVGVVLFLIIVGIGYGLAEGVETQLKDGNSLSASDSHWVGTGLYTFYFLAAIAVGLMVVSGIKKLIGR